MPDRDPSRMLKSGFHHVIGDKGVEPKLRIKLKPLPTQDPAKFCMDEVIIRILLGPTVSTIKHIALNLTRRAPGKDSLRLRRKVAAWDDDFLVSLLTA